MIKIVKVTGNSLSPFFLSGDFAIIRTFPQRIPDLKIGDTVVVRHPVLGLLIKQVRDVNAAQGYLEIEGAHPDSVSSQKLGKIPFQDLVGKVLFQIKSPR